VDAADRSLLEASVAAALESHGTAAATDATLADLGWEDMLHYEPAASTGIVFMALGVCGADSSALDDVVANRLDLGVGTAIVHPPWGSAPTNGGVESTTVSAVGMIGPRASTADTTRFLLGDGVATVARDDLIVSDTIGSFAVARATNVAYSEWQPLAPEQVAGAVAAARLALAHQLAGQSISMLNLARDHALERVQFGEPIAHFQAVRHKLAETLVANEAAAAALAAALDDPSSLAIDLARVTAGRAASEAGRHCQQVLAGVGFTSEHDFHRFLFGSIEIDGLYGTTTGIESELGHHLLDIRQVPRVIEL
jgi:hypothetical protein